MKRHWVFAPALLLAALAVSPRLGHAQSEAGWGPKLRITPYIGISPGIDQKGIATVFRTHGTTVDEYQWHMGSSVPLGLNAEYRFWNRFGVIGGLMWSSRGDGFFDDRSDDFVPYFTVGSNVLVAKLGPALHLQETDPDMQLKRLKGLFYLTPAWIHDSPKSDVIHPTLSRTAINQWGAAIGAEGELPLADTRFAFNAGLEDVLVFWDNAKYAQRTQIILGDNINDVQAVAISANKTHLFTGRVGLTFRF